MHWLGPYDRLAEMARIYVGSAVELGYVLGTELAPRFKSSARRDGGQPLLGA